MFLFYTGLYTREGCGARDEIDIKERYQFINKEIHEIWQSS